MVFNKLKNKQIQFYTDKSNISNEYRPIKASKNIPDWYKDMNSYMDNIKQPMHDGTTSATIKKCIPVFDSITSGYLILTHCDMHFVWDGVAHHVGMPSGNDEYIRTHPLFQANIHPDRKEYMSFFYKYVNPWSIKTPPGYSSLFIPPMHRDNFIEILPGIVDTDSFTSPVELPFIMSRFEDDILIPAGTPIAQIIPVKRDRWSISFADLSKDSKESRNIVHSRFFDSYKKSMWSKKSYE